MPTTGDRIREIRERKSLTQETLADLAGISKGFLSEVENNKRNISSQALLKIANSLGASVDYLLQGNAGATQNKTNTPVIIPGELSKAAEELNLTYNQTLELLDAHNSVIARRSSKGLKDFAAKEWKEFHFAINKVFK